MAIRGVLKSNEPVLRQKAKIVTEFDDRLWILLDDMKETMIFEDGVGLAAPQIGILKRVCVISKDGQEFFELINPVITNSFGTQTCNEGCLSLSGVTGQVVRPLSIQVEAFDRFGKKQIYTVSEIIADIFCHEIDHLDGILFIDKMLKPPSK